MIVVYQKFDSIDSLFNYPCNSLDLDISIVSNSSVILEWCRPSEIKYKMVLFAIENNSYAALPLLHSS